MSVIELGFASSFDNLIGLFFELFYMVEISLTSRYAANPLK
jgi:hypothetical protein